MYNMFDRMMLLIKGQVLYFGPTQKGLLKTNIRVRITKLLTLLLVFTHPLVKGRSLFDNDVFSRTSWKGSRLQLLSSP